MNPNYNQSISLTSQVGVRSVSQRNLLVTLFLAFSSGLPISLTISTLQAWYTVAGVSIVAIGLLSLIGQPYLYKFLWSPFLDRYVPPFLGRRRGWILVCQSLLVVLIAGMALLNPIDNPWLLAGVAFIVAFTSASQDIAIDAYRTDLLKPEERGLGSALTVTGYRVAMIISGGIALVLADHIGFKNTYLFMAALMAVQMIVTWCGPEPEHNPAPPKTLTDAIVKPFKEFLSRPYAWFILLFVVLYKLTDAFFLSLGTTFLIREVGFSLTDIGLIYKTVGIGATIVGGFLGGFLMIRMGLYRSLWHFGLLQGTANLAFLSLLFFQKSYVLLVGSIFVESFFAGMGTVVFLSYLMSLCDSKFTATQFALLSALSAVGRIFVGPAAGLLVDQYGWFFYFITAFLLCFPPLILLSWMKNRVNFSN